MLSVVWPEKITTAATKRLPPRIERIETIGLGGAPLILGDEPLIHNHLGGLDADDPGAKVNDVGVVVLLGKPGGVWLAAYTGPDTVDFVGGRGDTHPGTTDEHTAGHLAPSLATL